MKQIKLGAILSYLNLIFTIVLGIVVSPFTIKTLGDSEYGLYTLIGAFVGYLSILDLGLNNTVIRFVAQYKAEKKKKEEENFLAIIFIVYFIISIIILLLGLFFYWKLDSFFKDSLTSIELQKAKAMYIILIINIAISIPGSAFAGICSGYEKFIAPRLFTFLKLILRTIALVLLLLKGANALDIVILDTIFNILFIFSTAIYVTNYLKIKIRFHVLKFSFLKQVFNYSFWIFVSAFIYQFQWRTGQVILGSITNTVVVGVYGVGIMLGFYFTSFGNIIVGLFLPTAVQSVYNNDSPKKISNQMNKLGKITIVILLYVFGGFYLFGKDFIHLWVGDVYKDAYFIALLIMIAYILPISQGYANVVLEAKNKLKFKTISFFICSLLGTILGYFLSLQYGAKGMILGIFIGILFLEIIMNIYFHKIINLDIKAFFKEVIFRFFIPFAITVVITYFICLKIEDISWFYFICKLIIYSIVYGLSIYFILNRRERKTFFKIQK
jgi:O-antigen/teichoic acid export membrane protein